MTQVNSTVVANELLGLARSENRGLTPLKLVKLVYLCEGWSLALRDKSIIREDVQAWQYGPVIPELYAKIRQFKATPVTELECAEGDVSADQKDLIKSVYDAYKHLSGMQLSDLTHQAGTPWSKTWDKQNRKRVIATALIKDHFKELAAAG